MLFNLLLGSICTSVSVILWHKNICIEKIRNFITPLMYSSGLIQYKNSLRFEMEMFETLVHFNELHLFNNMDRD